MSQELPWNERITMLCINLDAATRDNVAKLATELLEVNIENEQLKELLEVYREKRRVDGLNGRMWDGPKYLEMEKKISKIEAKP